MKKCKKRDKKPTLPCAGIRNPTPLQVVPVPYDPLLLECFTYFPNPSLYFWLWTEDPPAKGVSLFRFVPSTMKLISAGTLDVIIKEFITSSMTTNKGKAIGRGTCEIIA